MAKCPSCKKRDEGNGRYCIYCGSILKPVFCSNCGTMNPEDLEQCLECGNPIPKLTGIRWGSTTTLSQPMLTASDKILNTESSDPEVSQPIPQSKRKKLLDRLFARLNRKEKPSS